MRELENLLKQDNIDYESIESYLNSNDENILFKIDYLTILLLLF